MLQWAQPADSTRSSPVPHSSAVSVAETLRPASPACTSHSLRVPLPSLSFALITFCFSLCYLNFPLPPPRAWGCIFPLMIFGPLKCNAFKSKSLSSHLAYALLFLAGFPCRLMEPDGGRGGNPRSRPRFLPRLFLSLPPSPAGFSITLKVRSASTAMALVFAFIISHMS